MSHSYIPLRLHTEFSIEDGMIRIPDVVARAAASGIPALGISDLMNMFGMVKFYKACRKAGIKPVISADVRVENPEELERPFRVLLMVRNHDGYLRLNRLLTAAYTGKDRDAHIALIRQEHLAAESNSGLICLSGAQDGEIGRALLGGNRDAAVSAVEKYRSWFGSDFYLELQRLPERPEWETVVEGSVQLAETYRIPVVATHPAVFMDRGDFRAHEVRVCIASGYTLNDSRRPHDYTPSQYFATAEEMAERFADIPEALSNTAAIARRCNLTLTLGKNFLPVFPTPAGKNLDDYLRDLSHEGLTLRLQDLYPDDTDRAAREGEYRERLDYELDIIIRMQFPGYFLIVQDFINWAKENGCPVGPGRGSGAGSLVAYALKITDLDPLRYNLLFERFLNPERVSMPDFDVDFCQENRGRVIQYVRHKYGEEAVSQIVTFSTLSSKSVVRDVGRVLDLPFGVCDRLSKLIPVEANKPLPLKKAMEAEPKIRELLDQEEADELMDLALRLEDLTRGPGMHAGGVLMAPGTIADFCPVYQASGAESAPVSMLDKDDVEQIGLVKFDFLGLRNLTVIEMAQNYIRDTTGDIVDVAEIPLDDAETYARIFAKGNTSAVFQFESAGMKKMLASAKPKQFEEIIAFVALYRPGPMDLIPDFIRRMDGEKFAYLHPLLEPVLEPTYGVMVYQEQVMQAAQVCGGYTLGGADLLRRAMGKKKVEEMMHHRSIFVEGAEKKGIAAGKANEIFDYMEKFAGYGFNKSHAAAYALIAYQTAWLKCHYPAEFMAAMMSCDLDNTDQLKLMVEDAVANGITFLPPDVNASSYRFIPGAGKTIRYALGAVKGVGEAAAEAVAAARETGGRFADIFDFCCRADKQHVNRRAVEALIRSGAFDSVDPNRAMLLANVDSAMEYAAQQAAGRYQCGLFDMAEDAIEPVQMQHVAAWPQRILLQEEKQALGFYFSGHPFAPYRNEVRAFAATALADIKVAQRKQWVAGFVTGIRHIMGKRGAFAVIELEDGTAKVEVVVAGDVLAEQGALLQADVILLAECKVQEDRFGNGDGLRITADSLWTLSLLRERYARLLQLHFGPETDVPALAALLQQYPGSERPVPVKLCYENDKAEGVLHPGSGWRADVCEALLAGLADILGEEGFQVGW